MVGERLPARFSLRSQLWFRWTGKCFETATAHIQNSCGQLVRLYSDSVRTYFVAHNSRNIN